MVAVTFENPFRPGAGHMPPYLAGRAHEQDTFRKHLRQTVITDNLIITGLRGVGKSVLLESLKPIARSAGWLWVGDDFTESRALTEEKVADSIINDLSLALAPIFVQTQLTMTMGFGSKEATVQKPIEYTDLRTLFENTPGVASDKLKAVLRYVGKLVEPTSFKGIIFAYDEAQNLGDRSQENEYPLSILLDVFQSIQKSPNGLSFLLVLTGLPTLFPKLNNTRTYTERMFDIIVLEKLTREASKEAITKPITNSDCPLVLSADTVEIMINMSGGYPYFIQFICKEVFDAWMNRIESGQPVSVPEEEILRKLDQRFFSGRWDNASDRQREFMSVVAALDQSGGEFTVPEVVTKSKDVLSKPFNNNNAQMMLKTLIENDFIFRNRRGKYSFAVPLLDRFIQRQQRAASAPLLATS